MKFENNPPFTATESLYTSDIAVLLFDTLTNPAAAGIRSSHVASRQLLYKFGTLCVDMQMQSKPGSEQVMLVGQILDMNEPTQGMARVHVCLLSKGSLISRVRTNDSGEFDFGMRGLEGGQLVFDIAHEKSLVVPVPAGEVTNS
jgi:hypothetical protein